MDPSLSALAATESGKGQVQLHGTWHYNAHARRRCLGDETPLQSTLGELATHMRSK